MCTDISRLNRMLQAANEKGVYAGTIRLIKKHLDTGRYYDKDSEPRVTRSPTRDATAAYTTHVDESGTLLEGMVQAFKSMRIWGSSESGQEREDRFAEGDEVLFDSGANCCVTHCKDDFKGSLILTQGPRQVEGIGKALHIEGSGQVNWTFEANDGSLRTLKLPAYYMPGANGRVASLQVILRAIADERISMNTNSLTLAGYGNVPSLTVPYHPKTHLPVASLRDPLQTDAIVMQAARRRSRSSGPQLPTAPHQSVTSSTNINLSEAEKELLRWHQRLGHRLLQACSMVDATGFPEYI